MAAADDAAFMRRAVELAERGRGWTSPNPMVGAVVVRGGVVVGEGYHPAAGEPHAEVFALRDAGDAASGATIYVTLEPCSHHGRTPPCSDALIAAQVRRCVVGALDPNPRVSSVDLLRRAGVEVETGVEAAACDALNEAFNHWIVTGRPLVTLKLAQTLDGRIATRTGASRWITSSPARRHVHRMRATSDAVLIGIGTALADDPMLTARDVDGPVRQPLRVVLDSALRLPPTARLLDEPGVIVATAAAEDSDQATALRSRGARVWCLPNADGQVDVGAVLDRLGSHEERPALSLLVEAGGTLAASFVTQGLADRLELHIAPKLFGGDGRPTLASLNVDAPDESTQLEITETRQLGPDLVVSARFVSVLGR